MAEYITCRAILDIPPKQYYQATCHPVAIIPYKIREIEVPDGLGRRIIGIVPGEYHGKA
jgi:hypothetical protein